MNELDTVVPGAPAAPAPRIGREEVIAAVANPRARTGLETLQRHEAYDWPRLFPKTEGLGAAGDIKRRVRMLKSVEPRFDYLLYPDERIEFVTRGFLNSPAEQYFLGLLSRMINRTLFLFTNYRVILIHCDRRSCAKSMMWQIPYDRIRRYAAGGVTGSVGFKLDDRKTYRFAGVPGADRKRLKAYVRGQIERVIQEQFQFPSHAARDALCPSCATPQPPKTRTCATCSETFVNPRVPAIMSLVIPGLGHLYLGHRAMAVFELLGFALLLLIGVAMISNGDSASIVAWLIVLAVANTFDAAITLHIARKGVKLKRHAWKAT